MPGLRVPSVLETQANFDDRAIMHLINRGLLRHCTGLTRDERDGHERHDREADDFIQVACQ